MAARLTRFDRTHKIWFEGVETSLDRVLILFLLSPLPTSEAINIGSAKSFSSPDARHQYTSHTQISS